MHVSFSPKTLAGRIVSEELRVTALFAPGGCNDAFNELTSSPA
jgi:hypothetical protein